MKKIALPVSHPTQSFSIDLIPALIATINTGSVVTH
jgi:hypothetical protein